MGLTIAPLNGELAKQKTFHCIIEVLHGLFTGLFTDLFSGLSHLTDRITKKLRETNLIMKTTDLIIIKLKLSNNECLSNDLLFQN